MSVDSGRETSASLRDVKQLLEQIIKDCGKIYVAKEETAELAKLCTTLSDRLGDRLLAPQQPGYDDLKSKLTEIGEQLAGWSKYNYVKSLRKRKDIEVNATGFVQMLNSILSQVPALHSSPIPSLGSRRSSRSIEGTLQRKITGDSASTMTVTGYNNPESLQRQNTERGTLDGQSVETSGPPPVKCMNKEVTKQGNFAFAEGSYCEVWVGVWEKSGGKEVGKEKVALKAIRALRSSGAVQARLEAKLPTWAELHHQNILPIYGKITSVGPRIFMVSPWRENGNLLEYVKKTSNPNKTHLLRGSAAGLSYLHLRGVVHGSVKCRNVLVSDEGDAQICDFGIASIVEDNNDTTVSKTVASRDVVRYSAPELLENNNVPPTVYSDTYSFAMLILECITEETPFSNLSSDAAVIHARISKRQYPTRPDGQNGKGSVSDDLWDQMMRCWLTVPSQRPTMENVHTFFLYKA